jgi:hypothetical protein
MRNKLQNTGDCQLTAVVRCKDQQLTEGLFTMVFEYTIVFYTKRHLGAHLKTLYFKSCFINTFWSEPKFLTYTQLQSSLLHDN